MSIDSLSAASNANDAVFDSKCRYALAVASALLRSCADVVVRRQQSCMQNDVSKNKHAPLVDFYHPDIQMVSENHIDRRARRVARCVRRCQLDEVQAPQKETSAERRSCRSKGIASSGGRQATADYHTEAEKMRFARGTAPSVA